MVGNWNAGLNGCEGVGQWRFKSGNNQVRESLHYFSNIYLTRSPLLSGLDLHAPSSAFLAPPPFRALACIGFEFKTLLQLMVYCQQAVLALLLLLLCASFGTLSIR